MQYRIAFVAAINVMAGAAYAQDDASRCEALAISPFDTQKAPSMQGVLTRNLNVPAAMPVCARAAGEQPDSPKVTAILARLIYLDGARTNHEDQSKRRACSLWQQAASRDYVYAIHQYGDCLYHGDGALQDIAAGIRHYQRAADMGNLRGACELGMAYAKGLGGLPRDMRKAIAWYQIVVKQDEPDVDCVRQLAIEYDSGKYTPQDYSKAAILLRYAAGQGDPWSFYLRGKYAELGLGGYQRNPEDALFWYRQAAQGGVTEASHSLDRLQPGWNRPAPEPYERPYICRINTDAYGRPAPGETCSR